MSEFIDIIYYGIKLSVLKEGNDHIIYERQQRMCAFVGYLVSQEHIFRKKITNEIESMTISGNVLGVLWKKKQFPLVWDIVTESWQGPIGMHGPVCHSIAGDENVKPKVS